MSFLFVKCFVKLQHPLWKIVVFLEKGLVALNVSCHHVGMMLVHKAEWLKPWLCDFFLQVDYPVIPSRCRDLWKPPFKI